MRYLALRAVVCVVLFVPCAPVNGQSIGAASPTPPAGEAADAAAGARIKAHVTFLADDLLEGRRPAHRGTKLPRVTLPHSSRSPARRLVLPVAAISIRSSCTKLQGLEPHRSWCSRPPVAPSR